MYPGEVCDDRRAMFSCDSGYQSCRAFRCQGYSEGSKCRSSLDCDPNHYCDSKSKQCAQVKSDGEECLEADECLRNSGCKYSSIESPKGVCLKLFTLNSGETFFARTEEDFFFCSDGYAMKKDFKGTMDPFNFQIGQYSCGGNLKSLKAGQQCLTDSECLSN